MRKPPTGTVTFLFTDIEGSTRLVRALGDGYHPLLARHHALMREAIATSGGVEMSTEGDSFFVTFARAPAAIACAVAAQRALHQADWPDDGQMRVRMGLHTGSGELSNGQYVGLDVHRAARIAAAAHGGQVVVSDATRAVVGDGLPRGVSMRNLGTHRLKDLVEPIQLYQLVIDDLPADFPALRSLGGGQLPEPLTSFVGREAELEAVAGLLEHSRLVTLTGPGGTGKTRLLIEVARRIEDRFADGAWFVPLDTVNDPQLVLPAIARRVGVGEAAGRPMAEVLADGLGRRQLLLALDNLEQVVVAGRLLADLLAITPEVRIACTSREVLKVSGEQEYAVPPLGSASGIELFVERARQVRPDFDPSPAELAVVAEICSTLDGLPLAIELAAPRIRLFPVAALLARLTDRLGGVASGARDAPKRQRTLRSAIEWSYDLLDPVEREVFARLGVFTSGANLAAIDAVVDPTAEVTGDVVAALTALVEKSLVRVQDGPDGTPRFRMLETIRSYAAERLAASDAHTSLRDRHLDYFVRLAEAVEADLFLRDPEAVLRRVEADHDNLRSAIGWSLDAGRPASGLGICAVIWRFWQYRGHLAEGRQLLERLLAAPDPASDALARARGLTAYGGVVYWQGDHDVARRAYEEALQLSRLPGDDSQLALACYNLGWMLAFARELPEANRLLAESQALYQGLGDDRGRLIVGEGLAVAAMIGGDLARARVLAEEVVDECRRLGMRFHYADTLSLLTSIYLELGDVTSARSSLREGAAVWKELGDVSSQSSALALGVGLALAEGRPRDGARLLGALEGLRDRGARFFLPSDVIPVTDPEPGVREQLSPVEFESAFAEGRAWPIERALDLVSSPEGLSSGRQGRT